MTRHGFLERLRSGLRGLPPYAIDDIVADYDSHFEDGLAAGRTEAQVAEALGDPERLARELRAEVKIKRWETEKNPAAAVGAIIALLGLGAIDIFILLPILFGAIGLLFALYLVSIGLMIGGACVALAGPFTGSGSPFAIFLFGVGLAAVGVCVFSGLTLASIGLVNSLVRYGRLHFRLLTPALSSKGDRT